jgi:hypothetical protein
MLTAEGGYSATFDHLSPLYWKRRRKGERGLHESLAGRRRRDTALLRAAVASIWGSPSASGRQSGASVHYRSEKGRVIVLTLDGFESSLICSHEHPRIPRGCREQVGDQIVYIAYDNRILFWSS